MTDLTERQTEALSGLARRILEEVTGGPARVWSMGWAQVLAGVTPTNAAQMAEYRGINDLILSITQIDAGYPTGWWAGIKQWNTLGNRVRKGERGTAGIRPEQRSSCQTCGKWGSPGCETPGHDVKRWLAFKGFMVWNLAQTNGEWCPPFIEKREPRGLDEFDLFTKRTGAVIEHRLQPDAFYLEGLDVIKLPMPEQFVSREEEASTTAHELVHWTGHRSRLDRASLHQYHESKAIRGREEFTAELAAAQVIAPFGFEGAVRENTTAYLQHWLKRMTDDPAEILAACSAATTATTYLQSLSQ